ncbi:hypothetical protein MCJ35_31485 [Enterocloster sp. OA13]|uniref:hypothetical protein n=1 Tax=Enterocloster sp. OA13 TaxID=2914161 RepID=UPI001F059E03|nr:hypothetical protein [Enterocloster sp. OA13]
MAVPDCNVVKPALYGVFCVLSPQLTIRFPIGPASASAIKSATTVRLSKLVLNTLRKMHKTEFCLNIYTDGRNTNLANTALVANTANTKIELNGPIKVIAYGSDRNKWAFQQQFSDGVILSLGISETEIFYDYYDGKSWTRKWTR